MFCYYLHILICYTLDLNQGAYDFQENDSKVIIVYQLIVALEEGSRGVFKVVVPNLYIVVGIDAYIKASHGTNLVIYPGFLKSPRSQHDLS